MGTRMHCVSFSLAFTIAVVVSGHFKCTNCSSTGCNEFEVAVAKRPRRDRFCRPLYTPTWEMRRLRHCVCKRGYVRNSWGDCIPLNMCRRCKCRLQKDWNLCATACPAACDMTISASCSKTCVPGCDCPPGWVLDQDNWKKCIKVKRCSPVCPLHSHFEPCVNSCAPKCGVSPAKDCKTTCYRGDCACDKGFAEIVQYGRKICVRQEQCAWYLRTNLPWALVSTGLTNGGASLAGVTNRVQGTMLHPGAITGIPGGTLLRGLSDNLITINGTGGLGTIPTSAPSLGGVGVVTGLPRITTGIGVIEGRPGSRPSVTTGNAVILSTGSATHPLTTLPTSSSTVSTTDRFPLSSTGNIGLGVTLRGTLPPTSTVHSTVSSGTGILSPATTVQPGTLRVGEGIPKIVASVPEAYRRLTLGNSGVPLTVPVVSTGSGIGGLSLSTLPKHSSGLAGTPTDVRPPGSATLGGSISTTPGSAIYSPVSTSTLNMPSTLSLPNDRESVASLSGAGPRGTSVTTGSVSALPTTQGGTLSPSAPFLTPAVVGGIGSTINSGGGVSTNWGSGNSAATISPVTATGSLSTLISTRGGVLTPSTTNRGGNGFPTSPTHLTSSITRNPLGAPLTFISEIGPSIGTIAPSNTPLTHTFSGVERGANSPNQESSGRYSLGIHTAGVPASGTAITTGSNTLEPVVSLLPGNVAHQGGGVVITSSSTGNVPGHINFVTGASTAPISVPGNTVRGLSGARKPLHGAASSVLSGITSAVPYLPGTAGYNNLLVRSHLRSAQTFSSILSGNSVLTRFPDFQKLYPEGVDLGEIQPELKKQVEVLLKRGVLRDES
uniref:TIL domain containing protein n=1 Tax=Rhipicephalus appendiculatus TaxID=34631 RepID=A0A131Z2L2_RHIAP